MNRRARLMAVLTAAWASVWAAAAAADEPRWRVEPRYAAVLGVAAYIESPAFGPDATLSAGVRAERGVHVLRAIAGIGYEPFALHTFNLETTNTAEVDRLVVASLNGSLDLDYAVDAAPWVHVDVEGDLDLVRPAIRDEHALTAELTAHARLGAPRGGHGLFGRVGGGARLDRYPNYLVSDRRLDQDGGTFALALGWVDERRLEARVGWALDASSYLDARYDRVGTNGQIERASASKRYLEHTVELRVQSRPNAASRVDADVWLMRNNSIHYARAVEGADSSGATDTRVYRDYFDFWRYGVDFDVILALGSRLELEMGLGASIRRFDTQEARDANNVFLGKNRRDVEVNGEVALSTLLLDRAAGELSLVAEFSHALNRSNMKRERSFATNYDVSVACVALRFAR